MPSLIMRMRLICYVEIRIGLHIFLSEQQIMLTELPCLRFAIFFLISFLDCSTGRFSTSMEDDSGEYRLRDNRKSHLYLYIGDIGLAQPKTDIPEWFDSLCCSYSFNIASSWHTF